MSSFSYRVATVWGIPIKVHVSLLIVLFYFISRFGLILGLLMEIGFATSIVLHELGHSLVALRKGCRVRQITLLFIGGAAQMERIPTRPADELLMAAAGPAVSLVLGGVLLLAGSALSVLPPSIGGRLNILQFLGSVNLALVVFNLLPSFPMDGGRIFRALLAKKLGRLRATFVAARLGRIMAILFGLSGYLGVRGLVSPRNWGLVAIAFFIYVAAGSEYRMVQAQEARRTAYGGGVPPPFDQEPEDEDEVVIGPPPYEKKRGDVHASDEDEPFRRMFRP